MALSPEEISNLNQTAFNIEEEEKKSKPIASFSPDMDSLLKEQKKVKQSPEEISKTMWQPSEEIAPPKQKERGVVSEVARGAAAGGLTYASKNFELLDYLATKVSDLTGTEKSGAFETLAKALKPEDMGLDDDSLAFKISRAFGEAIPNVAELALAWIKPFRLLTGGAKVAEGAKLFTTGGRAAIGVAREAEVARAALTAAEKLAIKSGKELPTVLRVAGKELPIDAVKALASKAPKVAKGLGKIGDVSLSLPLGLGAKEALEGAKSAPPGEELKGAGKGFVSGVESGMTLGVLNSFGRLIRVPGMTALFGLPAYAQSKSVKEGLAQGATGFIWGLLGTPEDSERWIEKKEKLGGEAPLGEASKDKLQTVDTIIKTIQEQEATDKKPKGAGEKGDSSIGRSTDIGFIPGKGIEKAREIFKKQFKGDAEAYEKYINDRLEMFGLQDNDGLVSHIQNAIWHITEEKVGQPFYIPDWLLKGNHSKGVAGDIAEVLFTHPDKRGEFNVIDKDGTIHSLPKGIRPKLTDDFKAVLLEDGQQLLLGDIVSIEDSKGKKIWEKTISKKDQLKAKAIQKRVVEKAKKISKQVEEKKTPKPTTPEKEKPEKKEGKGKETIKPKIQETPEVSIKQGLKDLGIDPKVVDKIAENLEIVEPILDNPTSKEAQALLDALGKKPTTKGKASGKKAAEVGSQQEEVQKALDDFIKATGIAGEGKGKPTEADLSKEDKENLPAAKLLEKINKEKISIKKGTREEILKQLQDISKSSGKELGKISKDKLELVADVIGIHNLKKDPDSAKIPPPSSIKGEKPGTTEVSEKGLKGITGLEDTSVTKKDVEKFRTKFSEGMREMTSEASNFAKVVSKAIKRGKYKSVDELLKLQAFVLEKEKNLMQFGIDMSYIEKRQYVASRLKVLTDRVNGLEKQEATPERDKALETAKRQFEKVKSSLQAYRRETPKVKDSMIVGEGMGATSETTAPYFAPHVLEELSEANKVNPNLLGRTFDVEQNRLGIEKEGDIPTGGTFKFPKGANMGAKGMAGKLPRDALGRNTALQQERETIPLSKEEFQALGDTIASLNEVYEAIDRVKDLTHPEKMGIGDKDHIGSITVGDPRPYNENEFFKLAYKNKVGKVRNPLFKGDKPKKFAPKFISAEGEPQDWGSRVTKENRLVNESAAISNIPGLEETDKNAKIFAQVGANTLNDSLGINTQNQMLATGQGPGVGKTPQEQAGNAFLASAKTKEAPFGFDDFGNPKASPEETPSTTPEMHEYPEGRLSSRHPKDIEGKVSIQRTSATNFHIVIHENYMTPDEKKVALQDIVEFKKLLSRGGKDLNKSIDLMHDWGLSLEEIDDKFPWVKPKMLEERAARSTEIDPYTNKPVGGVIGEERASSQHWLMTKAQWYKHEMQLIRERLRKSAKDKDLDSAPTLLMTNLSLTKVPQGSGKESKNVWRFGDWRLTSFNRGDPKEEHAIRATEDLVKQYLTARGDYSFEGEISPGVKRAKTDQVNYSQLTQAEKLERLKSKYTPREWSKLQTEWIKRLEVAGQEDIKDPRIYERAIEEGTKIGKYTIEQMEKKSERKLSEKAKQKILDKAIDSKQRQLELNVIKEAKTKVRAQRTEQISKVTPAKEYAPSWYNEAMVGEVMPLIMENGQKVSLEQEGKPISAVEATIFRKPQEGEGKSRKPKGSKISQEEYERRKSQMGKSLSGLGKERLLAMEEERIQEVEKDFHPKGLTLGKSYSKDVETTLDYVEGKSQIESATETKSREEFDTRVDKSLDSRINTLQESKRASFNLLKKALEKRGKASSLTSREEINREKLMGLVEESQTAGSGGLYDKKIVADTQEAVQEIKDRLLNVQTLRSLVDQTTRDPKLRDQFIQDLYDKALDLKSYMEFITGRNMSPGEHIEEAERLVQEREAIASQVASKSGSPLAGTSLEKDREGLKKPLDPQQQKELAQGMSYLTSKVAFARAERVRTGGTKMSPAEEASFAKAVVETNIKNLPKEQQALLYSTDPTSDQFMDTVTMIKALAGGDLTFSRIPALAKVHQLTKEIENSYHMKIDQIFKTVWEPWEKHIVQCANNHGVSKAYAMNRLGLTLSQEMDSTGWKDLDAIIPQWRRFFDSFAQTDEGKGLLKNMYVNKYFPRINDMQHPYDVLRTAFQKSKNPEDIFPSWSQIPESTREDISNILQTKKFWEEGKGSSSLNVAEKALLQSQIFEHFSVYDARDRMPKDMAQHFKPGFNRHLHIRTQDRPEWLKNNTDAEEVFKSYIFSMVKTQKENALMKEVLPLTKRYKFPETRNSIRYWMDQRVKQAFHIPTMGEQSLKVVNNTVNKLYAYTPEFIKKTFGEKLVTRPGDIPGFLQTGIAHGALSYATALKKMPMIINSMAELGFGNVTKKALTVLMNHPMNPLKVLDGIKGAPEAFQFQGLSRGVSEELFGGRSLKLSEFSKRFLESENYGKKAYEVWDYMGKVMLHPITWSTNFKNATTFLAALDEAGKNGWSMDRAFVHGLQKLTEADHDTAIPEAVWKASTDVVRTQWDWTKFGKSSVHRGPLMTLGTMFWRYPVREMQTLFDGIRDNAIMGEDAKAFRYTVALGAMVGMPVAAALAGFQMSGLTEGVMRITPFPVIFDMLKGIYEAEFGKSEQDKVAGTDSFLNAVGTVFIPGRVAEKKIESTFKAAMDGVWKNKKSGEAIAEASPMDLLFNLLGFPPIKIKEAYQIADEERMEKSKEVGDMQASRNQALKALSENDLEGARAIVSKARDKGINVQWKSILKSYEAQKHSTYLREKVLPHVSKHRKPQVLEEIKNYEEDYFPEKSRGKQERSVWSKMIDDD